MTIEEHIQTARLIIRGEIKDFQTILDSANALKEDSRFRYAGELYRILLNMKPAATDATHDLGKLRKDMVHCLYKDPDLPASVKYEAAFEELKKVGDLSLTQDNVTLGSAGAIFKRKWQYDNQFKNLLIAENFYKRGHDNWKKWRNGERAGMKANEVEDNGYTSINYAFLMDTIAAVRFKDAVDNALPSLSALERANKAAEVRRLVIQFLLGQEWTVFAEAKQSGKTFALQGLNETWQEKWAFVTLAEAYFGLGQYDGAAFFYQKYRDGGAKDWNYSTSAQQLILLTELQGNVADFLSKMKDIDIRSAYPNLPQYDSNKIKTEAAKCLNILYPNALDTENGESPITFRGKVGLAFSGGGFRASLYHVGVLARLAELGILRHIEVLSCVSGGSIVGAYYYMVLKRYHELYGDDLQAHHYVEIVKEIEKDFLAGVQKNLRVRVFTNPFVNLRIFFSKDYTRTHRMADLYEKLLYQEIIKNTPEAGKPLLMQNLKITPKEYAEENRAFNPKTENWKRRNKVPMLVLNATSLNTGHNWQFTASWMGEPPALIQQDVDSKIRLRRMYYEEAPMPYKNNVRLGQAVGASSCVPALFEPLLMPDLYENIDLQLVDGGVHDNQGVASLLEQECKIIMLSDACGQLADEKNASLSTASVFMRSDFILQERVRESQYLGLKARENANQLNALLFVHLTKDLVADPVNWRDCQEPPRSSLRIKQVQKNPDLTPYAVRREVQTELAKLRTDLDAFNDAEAYALMYSGYTQTRSELLDEKFKFLISANAVNPGKADQKTWRFLSVEDRMQDPGRSRSLLQRLKIGQSIPLKVFKVNWLMGLVGILIGLVIFALAVVLPLAILWGNSSIGLDDNILGKITLRQIGIGIAIYLITLYAGTFVERAINWKNVLLRSAVLFVGAFVMAFFSNLYIWFLNPIYLSFGKLANLDREDRLKKWLKGVWRYVAG